MKMKQTFLTVAALCSAGLLSAADFRIDISGERSKVEMEIKEVGESIRGEGAGWLGEEKIAAHFLRSRLREVGDKNLLFSAEDQWQHQSLPDGNHQQAGSPSPRV